LLSPPPIPSAHRLAPALALLLALPACGASTGLLDPPAAPPADAATCQPSPPTCVAPADDPCGPPLLVAAACDAATLAWRCPAGARVYARAPAEPTVCRPFTEPGGPVRALSGVLARVPTDDGRCLWVAEDVTLATGATLRNVAFESDPAAPFGACPVGVRFADGAARSAVIVEGNDPAVIAQVTGGYRLRKK
jgi:hypothetical protein